MALVVKDRVQETSTTTGTGSLTLLGAVTGFQTFSSAIGNTNTTYYTIQNGAEWEVGIGTVSAGALSRDTVLESSNGGSLVNFSAGSKFVFCTYPAEKAVYLDADDVLSGVTITAGDGTGFTLQDDVDATKKAQFQLSGISTGTTRTYTLPNLTGSLATTGTLTQTFSGTTTFSGSTVTVGSSTGNSTYGLGSGATTGVSTKNINVGTAGVSGSTTNINIGSAVSGSTTNVTANGTWTYPTTIVGSINGNAATVTNGLYTTDIGSTVQAYDANTTKNAATQTLTNKTISGSNNTLSNIGNSSLTNSAITINGTSTSLGGSISVGTVTSVATSGGLTGGTITSTGTISIADGGVTPAKLSTGSPSWNTSGNLSFNSGYGSVSTAYGCRAWVNFNGTGTVAILASGNVSSITDNGTGNYTINLTNAMPDTNYSLSGMARRSAAGFNSSNVSLGGGDTKSTTACQVRTGAATTAADLDDVSVEFFR